MVWCPRDLRKMYDTAAAVVANDAVVVAVVVVAAAVAVRIELRERLAKLQRRRLKRSVKLRKRYVGFFFLEMVSNSLCWPFTGGKAV